jgi:di/tricarboxylate transporter
MEAWGLFSVTPIGLALIATGIIYFMVAGRFVLPTNKGEVGDKSGTLDYFGDVYGINYGLYEVNVPADSALVGQNLNDFEQINRIRVIAMARSGEDKRIGPGALARDFGVEADNTLGIVCSPKNLKAFGEKFGLVVSDRLTTFADALSTAKAGIAELVIPPSSKLIDKSARDVWLRKRYGISLVALHRGGETFREGDGIRDMPFQAGDTLVCHTTWETLVRLESDKNFVVITTEYPKEEERPQKVGWAGLFFALALSLILFTDLRLSVALLAGAMGMILSGVLKMEEAYEAVSWKTVFLLASLIPLGLAVETSGTAKWIAEQVLSVVGTAPIWVIQGSVAVLATFFTLVMSNVGATVLLVPLAVNIAIGVGANPAVFALTVAIATSNSFLIPTHQVNALIMGPGGYRVTDFLRAGSVMTILFLIVMMLMMSLVF